MSGVRSTTTADFRASKKKHAQGEQRALVSSSFQFNKCADNTLSGTVSEQKEGGKCRGARKRDFFNARRQRKKEKKPSSMAPSS